MYRSDKSGMLVYETLDELLSADIVFVSEYNGKLYFRLTPQCYYDNTVWVVDKQTKKVSTILFTQYFSIEDKATPVNPDTLRKAG